MRLERASGHAGDSGLVGWISTNDVTLFTLVLVVVVSLLMNTNLVKRRKENERLSANLASTSHELNKTEEELSETEKNRRKLDEQLQDRMKKLASASSQLELTQQERDRLSQDLQAKLARIEELTANLGSLTAAKAKLDQERQNLQAMTATLSTEKQGLQQSLADKEKTLGERIAALTGDLEKLVAAKTELESERNRWKTQADQLQGIVATLTEKLSDADKQRAAMLAQAELEQKSLAAKAAAESTRADDYMNRLRQAAVLFNNLKAEKLTLEQQRNAAEQRFQQQLVRETVVNRELLGLAGKLQRVAVIFDASGSMKEQGTGSGDRWADAQRIAATWLKHLDVNELVLIVYSSDVRTFPENGALVNVGGADGDARREELMAQLRSVNPQGWTNTLDAMRKAYSYPGLDSIILFSDGAPTNANSGRFDPKVAEAIYELCRQHPNVPVNTIGLGNYFDPTLATFLRTVASATRGTFRGH